MNPIELLLYQTTFKKIYSKPYILVANNLGKQVSWFNWRTVDLVRLSFSENFRISSHQ